MAGRSVWCFALLVPEQCQRAAFADSRRIGAVAQRPRYPRQLLRLTDAGEIHRMLTHWPA